MKVRKPKFERVWLVFFRIDGEWQTDGEFWDRDGAYSQARSNLATYGWQFVVVPVEVPQAARDRMAKIDRGET